MEKVKKVKDAPVKIADGGRRQLVGFIEFVKSQGVMGFAMGLVLGTAATVLVNSLVNNVVMPPLGLLLGSADGLSGLKWDLGTTAAGEPVVLTYGVFLNEIINFLIIALAVYYVAKFLKVEVKKR